MTPPCSWYAVGYRMGLTLLVIDDDVGTCRMVARVLAAKGLSVIEATDGESGLRQAATASPDVVLLDMGLPDMDGMEALERLKQAAPRRPVIVLTGLHDVAAAVGAMQRGAADYLTKPVDPEVLAISILRAVKTERLEIEVETLRRRVADVASLATLMGPSALVGRVIDQVHAVAASNFTVLVVGETGTGKELVSQAIHMESARRDRPLVAIDCGAIPEALLESELFGHERGAFTGASHRKEGQFHVAQGGTVFLDEIGNMPLALQAKLLRVLESRQVTPVGSTRSAQFDLRFVAATNDDLKARVAEGRFRADLFFRLAQYTITLPPLRGRREDIRHLAQRFVAEASVELRRPVEPLTEDALALLEAHPWPGNVRELRNLVRMAVLQAKGLELDGTEIRLLLEREATAEPPPPPVAPVNPQLSLKQVAEQAAHAAERQAICQALRASDGNKSQAAKALQTDYKTLHVKMKSLGIQRRDFIR